MSNIVLSGKFGFLGLGDIVQLIGSVGGSGILKLTSEYAPDNGFVYFVKGDIYNAETALLKGIKAMYSFFGWTDAKFEFSQEDSGIKRVINESRMAIIMDGLRMLDDGSIEVLSGEASAKVSVSPDKDKYLPVITGPPADYLYVAAEEEFYKGWTIFQENTYGNWLWVILEGQVDIIKKTSNGNLKLLRLGEGAFVGNFTAFLSQSSIRCVTAVAVSNVQLGILGISRLSVEYASLSGEFKKIIKGLDKRFRQAVENTVRLYLKNPENQTSQSPVFSNLNKFSLITSGKACIYLNVKKNFHFACLDKDDFIGKIPFPEVNLGHEPDFASVSVSENFNSQEINTEKIMSEYEKLSPVLKNIIKSLAEYISVITKFAGELLK